MALAYAQSITAAAMKANFQSLNNISDKEIFYSIFDLINTEYAAMASAGLAVYTVTTGLQASLELLCERMVSSLKVEILKSFFVVLLAEFAAVAAGDLGYTQTDDSSTLGAFATFEGYLRISVQNYCNVEDRQMLNLLIDQIIAEHLILVAAN